MNFKLLSNVSFRLISFRRVRFGFNLFLSNAIYEAIDRCPQWHWQHILNGIIYHIYTCIACKVHTCVCAVCVWICFIVNQKKENKSHAMSHCTLYMGSHRLELLLFSGPVIEKCYFIRQERKREGDGERGGRCSSCLQGRTVKKLLHFVLVMSANWLRPVQSRAHPGTAWLRRV